MTTAKEILAMIETVDPSDMAKLDEIDARVWAYLNLPVEGLKASFKGGSVYYRYAAWPSDAQTVLHHSFQHQQFTRSRDALKAIRPGGWVLSMGTNDTKKWSCGMDCMNPFFEVHADRLPTEELAELHAIISAIAHERGEA